MAEVLPYGQMARSLLDIGKTIKLAEEVDLYIRMVMHTKDNGGMTRHTDKVSIFTIMV